MDEDERKLNSRPGRVVRIALVGVGLIILAAAAGAWTLTVLNSPPSDSIGRQVSFTVQRGESVGSIASRLQSGGVIRSARLLSILSIVQSTQDRFQSGNYLIPGGLTIVEIHDFFLGGRQQLVRITIPEGWTIRRIASHLEQSGIVTAERFVAATGNRDILKRFGIDGSTAEGFLYPDTYLFQEGLSGETIVSHMIERFFSVLESFGLQYAELSEDRLREKIVLASIIEREYMIAEEAPLIASVFYNRLEVGMRLESCATVVYVMTEELDLPHPSRLYYRDLERPSQFNTYLHAGLPPAPIANPGRVALNATLNPAQSEYRFFVLRGANAQQHHFSRNYQEHTEATVFYLRTPR